MSDASAADRRTTCAGRARAQPSRTTVGAQARFVLHGAGVSSVILLATDFSAVSAHAETVAIENARRGKASLHLLHVLLPDEGSASLEAYQGRIHALRDAVRARFEEDMPVHAHLRVGPYADTIVQVARAIDADLIVLGTHGHGRRSALGSVAEAVVRTAPCTVVIARPKARAGA